MARRRVGARKSTHVTHHHRVSGHKRVTVHIHHHRAGGRRRRMA